MWNQRSKRLLQQRWGEEGGWETGDSKELLAKALPPPPSPPPAPQGGGGDAKDKVSPALSWGSVEPWNALCEEVMRSHGRLHGKGAGWELEELVQWVWRAECRREGTVDNELSLAAPRGTWTAGIQRHC